MRAFFLKGLLVGYFTVVSDFSFSQEAFLIGDERHLQQVKGKIVCDDTAFEKVFPACTLDNVNFSVGRIVTPENTRQYLKQMGRQLPELQQDMFFSMKENLYLENSI